MKTLILDGKNEKDLAHAALIVMGGGLCAMPTETVYGLAADALDKDAVKNIFEAKGRPQDNPLIVHICSTRQLSLLWESVPEKALTLAKAFLHIHLGIEETEITDGSLHVLTSTFGLNTIENNGCFANLTEETVDTPRTVGTADTIDAERNFEKAEPAGIRMLTDITAQLVRGHIIIICLQRNAVQQQFIVLKKSLRSTTGKQPT